MTVDIMGVPYTVKEVPVIDKDTFTMGQINYVSQEILLDETLSGEMKNAVLLHEILHGICMFIGLNHINEDERAIQQLAAGLYSTFKSEITSSFEKARTQQ